MFKTIARLTWILALAMCIEGGVGVCAEGDLEQPALFSLDKVVQKGVPVAAPSQQTCLRCGIESLYLLSRLTGRSSPLEDVERLVPVGEHGSSLRDLQEAGRRLGLHLVTVRCLPAAIDEVILPAIAHLEPTAGANFNHFVLVLAVHGQSVVILDASENRLMEVPRQDLARAATGYYLMEQQPLFSGAMTALWLVTGVAVLSFWCWFRRGPAFGLGAGNVAGSGVGR